jgi:hypothetical protein
MVVRLDVWIVWVLLSTSGRRDIYIVMMGPCHEQIHHYNNNK